MTEIPQGPDIELELDAAAIDADRPTEPPCKFITGCAGSGKTWSVRQSITEDPKWGILAATTGVSAINLNTVTVNSLLGYFDTASLEDRFESGYLRTRLHHLARQYRNLVVDEVSMMDGDQLDIIHRAMTQANDCADVPAPMGLVAVGDFCQLPVVEGKWAFEAECWPEFERNTTRLTKNWRQAEGPFLDGLNLLRAGDGKRAAEVLSHLVDFRRDTMQVFEGTTIVATNRQADDYNWLRYRRLCGVEQSYPSTRWGRESGGWKLIPETLKLREGAFVTILVNDAPDFTYCNGDCGHVVEMAESDRSVGVRLQRNGEVVNIGYLVRPTEQRHAPDEFSAWEVEEAQDTGAHLPDGSYWSKQRRRWVRGEITYMPLRLAYAATCHRSQGLTLDSVQVDLRHNFMGTPAMAYTALSRCRTAAGLHLVGTPEMLARRCKVDAKVIKWI